MTIETMPEMLSVRQTARLLGVCMATVYRRLALGELPGTRLGNRTIRIHKRELLRVIGLDNKSTVLAGTAERSV